MNSPPGSSSPVAITVSSDVATLAAGDTCAPGLWTNLYVANHVMVDHSFAAVNRGCESFVVLSPSDENMKFGFVRFKISGLFYVPSPHQFEKHEVFDVLLLGNGVPSEVKCACVIAARSKGPFNATKE